MSDLYNEMLKRSIDRQAREILSKGATEQDRYGHLLDSVKGRNLEQEENNKRDVVVFNLAEHGKTAREQREREAKEST